MKRLQNIVGEQHGRLTIISENVGRKNHKQTVLARCSCGTMVEKTVTELRSGGVTSCGCYRREWQAQHGQKRRKGFGESSFNSVLNAYKQGAKRRNLDFSLSVEQFLKITQRPCAYCGAAPNRRFKGKKLFGHFVYNGVDRKDNTAGYTTVNCVPCCYTCNISKGTMTYRQFTAWIKTVYNHLFSQRAKPHPTWLLPEVHCV